MKWYFPAWNGDFRLEPDGDNCVLKLISATTAEMEQIHAFLDAAIKKKWFKKGETVNATDALLIKASVADAGKLLLKFVRPKLGTLTAVKMVDGKLQVTDEHGSMMSDASIDAIMGDKAQAAVSVSRPTPCCPDCMPGAIGPASEVLQTFLTSDQHESWARNRTIMVTGHLSGHRYLLTHRNHPRAVKDTRICYDVDGDYVLKFFDWSVPPEEEILATKLILEHREPWLRNEASLWHMLDQFRAEPVFKNPFGNYQDGTGDATIMTVLGTMLRIQQARPNLFSSDDLITDMGQALLPPGPPSASWGI